MTDKRIHNRQLKALVCMAPSDIHGMGLFAVRTIDKGEYIGTYWGPAARRDGTYVLWVINREDPDDIEGRSGRNLLRYLNHARPGNACFEGFDLYARVRIRAGSEITFKYDLD